MKAKALIAALAAALVFLGGYWLRGLQVKAGWVDQAQAQAAAGVAQAERTSDAVQTHAQAQAKTEIRYVTVTKEVEKLVERPVYLERCMDDDGLRSINAQILGIDSAKP